MIPTREQAWALLTEYTQSASLLKHALGVEAGMRAYARHFGEDEDTWGAVGLVHDFDYERHPSAGEHPAVGARIMAERGYDDDLIQAVLSHADHTGVPRTTQLQKSLYAVDELSGFIVAVALVRPSKSISDLPVKSVMKKFKDKAFCRAIDRDHLRAGAEDLGVDLREHVERVIEALRGISDELGLA